MIHYKLPQNWIRYDWRSLANQLVEARSAVLSLRTIPYQRAWVEALQQMELKREIGRAQV